VTEASTYDFLIVGAGLFGAVFAREMTDAGYRCLVIDKRSHIAGNVYTNNINGIQVHQYGAHIFHTNDETVWNYVNRFAEFNDYEHRVEVNYQGETYSFPVNLKTFQQIWGIETEEEAEKKLEEIQQQNVGSDLESWSLNQVGTELYERFIKGYTEKQWGKQASDLPSAIIKRIPVRTTADDRYFNDKYQGIPINGYTAMVEAMLAGVKIGLNADFFDPDQQWDKHADRIVFTGAIDAFYKYKYGALEYRSLRFEHELLEQNEFQNRAVVNYTEAEIPYTRIIEHKHFNPTPSDYTVITREYPQAWNTENEAYYPIRDARNLERYNAYKKLAESQPNYIFGGRLAEYRYYDMHQVIASALSKSKKVINELKKTSRDV